MEQTDFLKRLDDFEKLLEQLDWFSNLTDIKEVPFGDPALSKYYDNASAPIGNLEGRTLNYSFSNQGHQQRKENKYDK